MVQVIAPPVPSPLYGQPSFRAVKSGVQTSTGSYADITGFAPASILDGAYFAWSMASGELLFGVACTYLITIDLVGDNTLSNRIQVDLQAQIDSGSGYAGNAELQWSNYALRNGTQNRGGLSATFLWAFGIGDKLKFMMRSVGEPFQVDTGEVRFSAVALVGALGAIGPAGPEGGAVKQVKYFEYKTETSTTAAIPVDNSKPQSNEGFEIFSESITISSETARLLVILNTAWTVNNNTNSSAALFRNSESDSMRHMCVYITVSNALTTSQLIHDYLPGASGLETIKVRMGSQGGNTLFINRGTSGGYFDDTFLCSLTLLEYEP